MLMGMRQGFVLGLAALLSPLASAATVQVSGVMVAEAWAQRGEGDCGAVLAVSSEHGGLECRIPEQTDEDALHVSFGCAMADKAAERRAASRLHQSAALAYALSRPVMVRVRDGGEFRVGTLCSADRLDVIHPNP